MTDLTGDIARLGMSRRRILQAALLAGPGAMALAACARADSSTPTGTAASGAATLQIASPTNPVKWPINPGNEASFEARSVPALTLVLPA